MYIVRAGIIMSNQYELCTYNIAFWKKPSNFDDDLTGSKLMHFTLYRPALASPKWNRSGQNDTKETDVYAEFPCG